MYNNKKRVITLYSLHIPVIILIIIIAVFAVLFAGGMEMSGNGASVLGSKANNNKSKSVKNVQPTTAKGQQHKKVITDVVGTLETVAETEESAGNTEVADEVAAIAETEDEAAAETVEALDEAESKPRWQVFLFGSDYKNLGQLRSSLAHNTNSIRKLTKVGGTVEESGSNTQVQASLAALELERERIYNTIRASETQFSLLGWVVRFLTGYTPLPPEPAPTPIPTPTGTPGVTPTPEPSNVPEPTVTPEPTAIPSPTP